ncbi:MAG: hypothetical protein IKK59_03045 [Lachnospiraceae bacterium]|nr:hypothetical protein [Lachnospiraceae bacterium]
MAIIKDAALVLGLNYNKINTVAWGVYRGFTMVIEPRILAKKQEIKISLCASFQGEPITAGMLLAVRLPDKANCFKENYKISIVSEMAGTGKKNVERILDASRIMVDYIIANMGVNCDSSGVTGETTAWRLQGNYTFLTKESAEVLQRVIVRNSELATEKKENYVFGICGALIGSVVGGAVTLLVAQLGFISCLCGIIMGIAVVWGYKKLARKFSIVSLTVCILISAAITYFVYNLDAAIEIYQTFKKAGASDITLNFCLKNVKNIFLLTDSMRNYYLNLVLMMLAGVGCTGAVSWIEYRIEKEQYEMYQLK